MWSKICKLLIISNQDTVSPEHIERRYVLLIIECKYILIPDKISKLSINLCHTWAIIRVNASFTAGVPVYLLDLADPWIALRNLWILTSRRNPWIAQGSCLRDLWILRITTGYDRYISKKFKMFL